MSLKTIIFVVDEVPWKVLWLQANRLIDTHDCTEFINEPSWRQDGSWRIRNRRGQGMCALLGMDYRPHGPLRTTPQSVAHSGDCDSECDGTGWTHYPACHAQVDYDTGYGYQGPHGEGCGTLHAVLVAKLGRWLTEHGVRFKWEYENTGEIFDGFDGLAELAGFGRAGRDWFTELVAPIIPVEVS